MRQKVLLAAALLHDPEILVLDEPLSGLDVSSVLVVKALLRELAARGRVILYSTHLLEIAERLCARVLILHGGAVVADDSVSNLRGLQPVAGGRLLRLGAGGRPGARRPRGSWTWCAESRP